MSRRIAVTVGRGRVSFPRFGPILWGALLAGLLAASPVLADNGADARLKFKAGAAAFKEGRYKDAIDLFLQANKLDPHPELILNVAQAHEKLGNVPDALRSYRDYLRLSPDADERVAVEKIIVTLQQRLREKGLQQVAVLSDPAGARVFLDGIEIGSTPTTFETRPGKHALILKAPGRPDLARDVVLPEDHAIDVDVKLPAVGAPGTTSPALSSAAPTAAASVAPAPTAPTASAVSSTGDVTPGIAAVRPWTWAAFSVGLLGFGTAAGLEAARAAAESAARADPTQIGYKSSYDTMISDQTGARIMVGIGAAGVLAGAALLVVDLRAFGAAHPSKSVASGTRQAFMTPSLDFGCALSGCGLSAKGRF